MPDHSQSLPAPTPIPECPRCRKPEPLCICDGIVQIDNKVSLLILQHPQEQDRALGTARVAGLHFKDSMLKVGLSWPSLSKILGRDVDPQRWAILYLGSAKVADLKTNRNIVAIDKKGQPEEDQRGIFADLQGIIVLDGAWSQAKALWWRNAWMLKCRRVILGPEQPSRYGKLRREPRRDGLSTLESIAMLLAALERRPEIETALLDSFERMLAAYREAQATIPDLTVESKPHRHHRRKKPGDKRSSRK